MSTQLQRDDLLEAYKAASQFDASKPVSTTKDSILSYAARAAKVNQIDTQREAQNDHSWRITGTRALGGLMLMGVVGMLMMRMFPDVQKQQALEAPSSASASQDAVSAPAPTDVPATQSKANTSKNISPSITSTVQGELKQSLGASANAPIDAASAVPATPPAPAAIPAPAPERMVARTEEKNKLEASKEAAREAGKDAAMATTSASTAKSTADVREMPVASTKRMASPSIAMPAPAPAAAPAAPAVAAPTASAPPMGMAFPASAPNPSELLLALINDERGACKPSPNLDAVRRLLAQGANPNYDKFPFGDHGTITRRAQLCGFGDVVRMLETKP